MIAVAAAGLCRRAGDGHGPQRVGKVHAAARAGHRHPARPGDGAHPRPRRARREGAGAAQGRSARASDASVRAADGAREPRVGRPVSRRGCRTQGAPRPPRRSGPRGSRRRSGADVLGGHAPAARARQRPAAAAGGRPARRAVRPPGRPGVPAHRQPAAEVARAGRHGADGDAFDRPRTQALRPGPGPRSGPARLRRRRRAAAGAARSGCDRFRGGSMNALFVAFRKDLLLQWRGRTQMVAIFAFGAAALLLYDAGTLRLLSLLAVILLGTAGLSAPGTLYAAMTSQTRARQTLLPLLLFPLVVPVLLAAVKATSLVILDDPMGQYRSWITLLGAFAVIHWALGGLLFGRVVED